MRRALERIKGFLVGQHEGLTGYHDGLRGDCSGLRGDLDACDHKGGNIADLVKR